MDEAIKCPHQFKRVVILRCMDFAFLLCLILVVHHAIGEGVALIAGTLGGLRRFLLGL